jgi:TPR repeat protein
MRTLLVALILVLATPAMGETFEDGMRALQDGKFADARGAFRPLAADGDGNAQFMLGVMHENGLGTAKDPGAAAAWYKKAAMAGVASAQFNLGVFYQLGKGVPQDPAQALKFHGMAAAQGHSRAQNNIGTMYYTGDGALRDPVEAWKWLTLASRGLKGEARDIAKRNIAAIEGELAPDALAEAKRRAAAWKPRK